jgi:hypothetical protein
MSRELRDLRRALHARDGLFDPAQTAIKPHNTASAEGFSCCVLTVICKKTGEKFSHEVLTEAMREAREEGLGDHPPARVYYERLHQLPPDPRTWTHQENCTRHILLAQSRHLFLLAMQLELQATPQFEDEAENIEAATCQVLANAARTFAQGFLLDGVGEEVTIPETALYHPEDFPALRWPRFYLAETWILCQRHERDRGLTWDAAGQAIALEHVHDPYWWPLINAADLDELPEIPSAQEF